MKGEQFYGDGMGDKSRYRNMYQSEASGSNAGAVNSWGRTRRPKELRDPGPIIEKYGWGNNSPQYGGRPRWNYKNVTNYCYSCRRRRFRKQFRLQPGLALTAIPLKINITFIFKLKTMGQMIQ